MIRIDGRGRHVLLRPAERRAAPSEAIPRARRSRASCSFTFERASTPPRTSRQRSSMGRRREKRIGRSTLPAGVRTAEGHSRAIVPRGRPRATARPLRARVPSSVRRRPWDRRPRGERRDRVRAPRAPRSGRPRTARRRGSARRGPAPAPATGSGTLPRSHSRATPGSAGGEIDDPAAAADGREEQRGVRRDEEEYRLSRRLLQRLEEGVRGVPVHLLRRNRPPPPCARRTGRSGPTAWMRVAHLIDDDLAAVLRDRDVDSIGGGCRRRRAAGITLPAGGSSDRHSRAAARRAANSAFPPPAARAAAARAAPSRRGCRVRPVATAGRARAGAPESRQSLREHGRHVPGGGRGRPDRRPLRVAFRSVLEDHAHRPSPGFRGVSCRWIHPLLPSFR